MNATRYIFIDYIKTIACLLIINTHSAPLFPEKISFLSFGGDIGNNLFFMATGFLLYESINKTSIKNYPLWIKKRLYKILPITTIFNIFYIFKDKIYRKGLLECLKVLTIPNGYWFICATILISSLLFLYGKINLKESNKMCLILCLLILHVILDTGLGSFSERYIAGVISEIVGYEINIRKPKKNIKHYMFTFVIFFAFFIILKIKCIGTFNIYTHLLQTILILIFNFDLFMYLKKKEEDNELHKYKCFEVLSNNSLYAYLFGTQRVIELFKIFIFPMNYFLCSLTIVIVAKLIGFSARYRK